jgi:hypothetical protein
MLSELPPDAGPADIHALQSRLEAALLGKKLGERIPVALVEVVAVLVLEIDDRGFVLEPVESPIREGERDAQSI